MAPAKKSEKEMEATIEAFRDDLTRVLILEKDMDAVKGSIAELRVDVVDIRNSIAGLDKKMGLLELIAQKVLGEDHGKPEKPSHQQEKPIFSSQNVRFPDRNSKAFGKQVEMGSQSGNPFFQGSEFQFQMRDEVDVVGSLTSFSPETNPPVIIREKKFDLSIEMPLMVTDHIAEMVVCEKLIDDEDPFEAMDNLFHNEQGVSDQTIVEGKRNSKKKKKKRWKATQGNQEHIEKGMTSLSCEEIRNGVCLGREEVTQPHDNEKNREANMDVYACQVFVEKSKARKRVIMHYHLMECVAEKLNKKTGVHIKRHKLHKINKGLLLMATKRKKKRTRHEKREQRGIKPHKPGNHQGRMRKIKREEDRKGIRLELEFARCLWEHTIAVKKLAKWRKRKSKQICSKQWSNIKKKLCGKHISSICYSKLVCELSRKNFSGGGRRNFYKKFYRMGDRLLLLNGLVELYWGLWLAANTRKRAKTKCRRPFKGESIWLVIATWTKFKFKQKHNRANKIFKERLSERTADVLLLGLDSSYEMLRLQWLETWKDLEMKLEEPEDENKEMEEIKERIEGMCKVVNDALEDKVEVVIVSDRVVNFPCYLVTCDYRWTADVKRNVKAQALGDSSMSGYMTSKGTMEINLENLIVGKLRKRADADNSNKSVEVLALLLLETALITSDFSREKSSTFKCRIHMILKLDLSFDDKQKENRRIQMLQPVKQLSELCVPAVLAAFQLEETYTEADMVQEHQGFDKAWQKRRDDSSLASDALLQLLLRPTMDCCSSYYVLPIWTALGRGKAAWRTSFLSMTLRTRSISMAPVMISVPKEEEGPMDTSPRRGDHE